MLGVAGFVGPFLDYLRPTKSPYLVVIFVAVVVLSIKVGSSKPADLDRPDFFVPIFLMIAITVALSLLFRRKAAEEVPTGATTTETLPGDTTGQISNAKYENDLDGVFKFSRALCLAAAAVMLYVYVDKKLSDNLFVQISYAMILVQMATFLTYMTFRHFKDEDLSNMNIFQVAFITAVFFAGSTYIATKIDMGAEGIEYGYYCKGSQVFFRNGGQPAISSCPPADSDLGPTISEIKAFYGYDYKQLTFIFLGACWLVYELFWLIALMKLAGVMFKPASRKSPV